MRDYVSSAGLSEARSEAEPVGEPRTFERRCICLFISPTGLTRLAPRPKARGARPSGVPADLVPQPSSPNPHFQAICRQNMFADAALLMRANERQRRFRAT